MNVQNDRHDEINNIPVKRCYDCTCGCGLTFIQGEGIGLKIDIELDDAHEPLILREDLIMGVNWKYYISHVVIETWGDLMEVIEKSVEDYPNDRVWCHLEPYLDNPDNIPYDTLLHFIYI